MQKILRATVASLMAATIGLTHALPPATAQVASRAEYEACQTQDEESFRVAIEAVTIKALRVSMAGFDYRTSVGDAWRRGGMDLILDARIDVAVSEVQSETSWGGLIQSLTDSKKAEQLGAAVAGRVYRSDAMKAAIERLAVEVGTDVGKQMEIAMQDAAEPALLCLQAYLGARYGKSVGRVVTTGAGEDFGIAPQEAGANVGTGDVLVRRGGGITGAAILLLRRQLATMAARIGQRLVGSVLSRLVSTVAGGVGVVLIAKDVWELRNGVMPIIAEEMKAPTTKAEVQDELAKGIAEEISIHVEDIGRKSAGHMVGIWQDFRRAHEKTLDLASRNEAFKTFVNALAPSELPRLDEVVALLLESEGESGILARLANGTLATAVKDLAPPALEIARTTRSIQAALQWSTLAGKDIGRVVEYEIYRRSPPEGFTKTTLQRLLALDDRLAITRLATISQSARDGLFDLETQDLKALTRNLAESELETLARYLTGLEKNARERVLQTVAAQPGKMKIIASDTVRNAILASRDQAAAVAMMLREDGLIPLQGLQTDIAHVWNGRVSPFLMWEKHPISVGLAGFVLLLLILRLRRLFLPRRPAAVPPS